MFRKKRQQSYDPINLEALGDHVDWVMEDSPSFLTNEEVDTLRKDLTNMTIQPLSNDIGIPLSNDIVILIIFLFQICFILVISKC